VGFWDLKRAGELPCSIPYLSISIQQSIYQPTSRWQF
jgi:hypothetical protein